MAGSDVLLASVIITSAGHTSSLVLTIIYLLYSLSSLLFTGLGDNVVITQPSFLQLVLSFTVSFTISQ